MLFSFSITRSFCSSELGYPDIAFGAQYFFLVGDSPGHYRMLGTISRPHPVMTTKNASRHCWMYKGRVDLNHSSLRPLTYIFYCYNWHLCCDNMLIFRSACQILQSSLFGFSKGLHWVYTLHGKSFYPIMSLQPRNMVYLCLVRSYFISFSSAL